MIAHQTSILPWISFSYTTAALLAGVKSVTRRDWTIVNARRFREGALVRAYDRQPRFGGRPVAVIALTAPVIFQRNDDIPDSDYEAEGFPWLIQHPEKLPLAIRESVLYRGLWTREWFEDWRRDGGAMWVIRFKIVEVLDGSSPTVELPNRSA